MTADRPAGRLVVLCGLPGSGKTTLATALEARSGAVRLCPDDWMEALGVDLWDAEVRARIEALQWTLAQRLLATGATVVIEWGVWSRAERDVLLAGARALGAAVELHHLDVPLDELWARVSARNLEARWSARAMTRDELAAWSTAIERPTPEELALYDPPLAEPPSATSPPG